MSGVEPFTLAPDVEQQLAAVAPRELVVALPTYNNAATVATVAAAIRAGVEKHFGGVSAAVVNSDAGSSDATAESLAEVGLPLVSLAHEGPVAERVAVPFHGIPGREAALRASLAAARRLSARAVVILEADVTSVTDEWIERLARPAWDGRADLVVPAYARHRYDGTITNLLLAPLLRALFGRRLHQPLPGAGALSARLVEHLLDHPRWPARARETVDVWMLGTAIADGFALLETWLGRRRVESQTRTADLPAMVAQTVGAIFTAMERYDHLWREVRDSVEVPASGGPLPPSADPVAVDVDRMVAAFHRGLRDLPAVWENVLAPETLGDVLSLGMGDRRAFRFPDELWARAVYDFALGHRYNVVHREHLLRALVPLYLGRTAAFILATQERDAEAAVAHVEAVARTFERQKRYLAERWL